MENILSVGEINLLIEISEYQTSQKFFFGLFQNKTEKIKECIFYLFNKSWIKKWKSYSLYDYKTSKLSEKEWSELRKRKNADNFYPGFVDNSLLFEDKERKKLKPEANFYLINRDCFDIFVKNDKNIIKIA